jgi:hypothetical protein
LKPVNEFGRSFVSTGTTAYSQSIIRLRFRL